MKIMSRNAVHNGLNIHFLDSINEADPSLTPIVICPGLSETAEEYVDLLEYLLPRRGIVLSFRGRGLSDTPDEGYDLNDHVTDIESVVREAGISYFHLFSYSRGVSYVLEYANIYSDQIASLVVEDYPAEHKAMSEEWQYDYIHNYLFPFSRQSNIRQEAVRGIQRESIQRSLQFNFDRPVLVIRGLLAGSLISDEDLDVYKSIFPNIQVCECANSGHDIRNTEKEILYQAVKVFLDACL